MRTHRPHAKSARQLRWLAACGCALVPGVALAADDAPKTSSKADEPDFTAMSLEDRASVKGPTVFGASKHEQKVTEAPSSVSIVTRQDIQEFGHRTLGDILRSERGFYVTHDRGYNSIGMCGINIPGDFGGRLLITGDGHRLNDIKDLIGVQQDPADSLYYFDNVESVKAKGVEVEVAGQRAKGQRGRASYTYTHTEDTTTGQRLSNSPEHLSQLSLSVPLWQDELFASVELQGMCGRLTVRGGSGAGFVVANATLFSRELVSGLEVSASVYDLSDQCYRDPVANDFTQDSIQQDGRTFGVKLTYRFCRA